MERRVPCPVHPEVYSQRPKETARAQITGVWKPRDDWDREAASVLYR